MLLFFLFLFSFDAVIVRVEQRAQFFFTLCDLGLAWTDDWVGWDHSMIGDEMHGVRGLMCEAC